MLSRRDSKRVTLWWIFAVNNGGNFARTTPKIKVEHNLKSLK